MNPTTPHIKQSFVELLQIGLKERCLRLPIGFLLFFILLGFIDMSNGGAIENVFSKLFLPTGFKGIPDKYDPPLLVFLVIAGLLDAFVWAVYWYARVRNPRYIAKQQAYERMQEERAAKQAAANEPGAADKPGNGKTS